MLAVLIWGTTWHAIVYQIAHAAPEVGVALRFGLAGVLVLALAAGRGASVRLGAGDHLMRAAQGMFMYSLAPRALGPGRRGYSASPLIVRAEPPAEAGGVRPG